MKTYKNIEDLYDQLMKSKLAKLLETLDNKIQFTEDHKSINIYNPNTGNELEIDELIKLFMNDYLAKNKFNIGKIFLPHFIYEMSYNFGLPEKIINFYLEKEGYILDQK